VQWKAVQAPSHLIKNRTQRYYCACLGCYYMTGD